jgi:hypothetical protein
MNRLPRLADPDGLSPLFRLSLRLRLAAYGRRYGAALRLLANLLDTARGAR